MKNILTLIFVLTSLTINAQIVGKTTVLKINGDPNSIIGLEDQTGYYESVLAQDTVTGLWYDWKAGRTPVWQLQTGANTKKVSYVSQSRGNNQTGNGSQNYPYADPWFAVDSTDVGGTVFVLDGNYKLDTIGGSYGNVFFPAIGNASATLIKKDVSVVCSKGVKFEYGTLYVMPMFYDTTGYKFNFVGGTVKHTFKPMPSYSVMELGKEGKVVPAVTNLQFDSLIIGSGDYRWPLVYGNVGKISLGGNYLYSDRAMVMFTIDTVQCDIDINFKEGFLTATDLTFTVRMMNNITNIVFGKLTLELDFHLWRMRNAINTVVNFHVGELYAKRWGASVNKNIFSGEARNATEFQQNSIFNFTCNTAVLDSVSLTTGSTNRFAGNTNNKYFYSGNFFVKGSFLFSNQNDNPIGLNTSQYYLNNSTVHSTNEPPIIILNDNTGVFIQNTAFVMSGDTSFIRAYSGANLFITNSSFYKTGVVPFAQAITGTPNITLNNSSYTGPTPTTVTITSNSPSWKAVTFTASFSQSTHTTTTTKLPTTSANLIVIKDGLELTDTIDYTYIPSTGVITFIPALAGGEVIKIRWFD